MPTQYRSLILASVLGLVAPSSAYAGFESGNDLLRACRATDVALSRCFGYLMAVNDAWEGFALFYIPNNTEAEQLRQVVVRALEEGVTTRQDVAAALVYDAYAKAWPCPKALPKGH